MKKFIAMLNDERGATAIEYGLIAALISIVAVSAMRTLGTTLSNTFSTIAVTEQNADR